MERMLEKLAQQLNGFDEASLLSLWDKYAGLTEHFEPTKRWEEGVLIFCMLQAVHWKNKLFNHHLLGSIRPGGKLDQGVEKELFAFARSREEAEKAEGGAPKRSAPKGEAAGLVVGSGPKAKQGCKVLVFRPRRSGKP